jgi:hypothetical protein
MAQIVITQLKVGDLLHVSSSLYPKDGPEKVEKIELTSMGIEVTTSEETYVYPNSKVLVTIFNDPGSRFYDDLDY